MVGADHQPDLIFFSSFAEYAQASSSGEEINAIVMDPTGNYLLALAPKGNILHVYSIDAQSGGFNSSTPTTSRRVAKGPTSMYTSILPSGNPAVFLTYESPVGQIQQFTLDVETGHLKSTFPANIRLSQNAGMYIGVTTTLYVCSSTLPGLDMRNRRA